MKTTNTEYFSVVRPVKRADTAHVHADTVEMLDAGRSAAGALSVALPQ